MTPSASPRASTPTPGSISSSEATATIGSTPWTRWRATTRSSVVPDPTDALPIPETCDRRATRDGSSTNDSGDGRLVASTFVADAEPELVPLAVLEPLDQPHPDLLGDADRGEVVRARVGADEVGAERLERVAHQRADRFRRVT